MQLRERDNADAEREESCLSMISIDFQCGNGHVFEGMFKDYQAFKDQHENKMVHCPLCGSDSIKRKYTGCSIQARPSIEARMDKKYPTMFEAVREMKHYVKENFEDVGNRFSDVARSMHYGQEEERGIYGESSPEDIRDLHEEGVPVLPIPDIDGKEN